MVGFKGLVRALVLLGVVAAVVYSVQAKDEPAELKSTAVNIQDIIGDEAAFHDKMVVIEGTIAEECGSGCWFIVDDQTARIYVDINPSNFVIPQKRGSEIKVYGEVTTQDGDPMMIGKIVEIDGEIYR